MRFKPHFLALAVLCLVLVGCAPACEVDLDELDTGAFATDVRVEQKEDAVYVSYDHVSPNDTWAPWPWRSNHRHIEQLRFFPQEDGTCLVEFYDSPTTVGMYRGNTMVGHGDPAYDPNADYGWKPYGSTAEKPVLARIWKYARRSLSE